MKLRLFTHQLLVDENCFELSNPLSDENPDLPVAIEGEIDQVFHLVHSNPGYLAYLVGLSLLQAWALGIDETGMPPLKRRPILVVTNRPGRFIEAYLALELTVEGIKKLCRRRRITLHEKTGNAPLMGDRKSEYWDEYVRKLNQPEERLRLHNYFPAYQISHSGDNPRLITGRQYMGREDEAGPALLITRKMDERFLAFIEKQYQPLLAFFEMPDIPGFIKDSRTPTVIYHPSIFSSKLLEAKNEQIILLPDSRFEQFCKNARLSIVESQESDELLKAWHDVDDALQELIKLPDQRQYRVLIEVRNTARCIRNLLLSIPVEVEKYEQALRFSQQPENFQYEWSVTPRLKFLKNRQVDMAAIGEWEEFLLSFFVERFEQLREMHDLEVPKKEPLMTEINKILSQHRKVALIVNSLTYARGLEWLIKLPEPFGLNLPVDRVVAIALNDISMLDEDQDCIIPQAFEPDNIFPRLARKNQPRQITMLLSNNELNFFGKRILELTNLFPNHPVNNAFFSPIRRPIKRLTTDSAVACPAPKSPLLSAADFEMMTRIYDQESDFMQYSTVLVNRSRVSKGEISHQTSANLVRFEGGGAVFLEAESQVPCLQFDGTIENKSVISLRPGNQLIIVNPVARESIVHHIMDTISDEQFELQASKTINRWHEELNEGIERRGMTYEGVLNQIKTLGSQLSSSATIGLWVRKDALGPLDARDLLRVGMALGSEWLIHNWQVVAAALSRIRNGNRLLGRQITRIIQKAAAGNYALTAKERKFLQELGVTTGELQDAASLLTVDAVSEETRIVAADRIGKVIFFELEE